MKQIIIKELIINIKIDIYSSPENMNIKTKTINKINNKN